MSEMCGMLSPEGIHSIHSKRQGIYPKGRDHIVHCELECEECGPECGPECVECGLECGPECEECGPECVECGLERGPECEECGPECVECGLECGPACEECGLECGPECVECGLECGLECGPECVECGLERGPECEECGPECVECGLECGPACEECGLECGPECVECGLECGLECGPECEECRVKRIKSSGVSNLICMGHTCWYLLVPARVPYIYFIWLRQTILFCFIEVPDREICAGTCMKQRKIVWNVWNVRGMSGMSSECVECVECWRRGTCAGAQVYIPHIPEHSRHSWACLHSLYLSEANKIVWRGKMKSMGAPAGTCWYLLVPYI